MDRKMFYFIFFGLIICHMVIISMIRLFPFIDLPMHLASSTIVRYYNDADNAFRDFFVIRPLLFQPNTFHLLFCSLKVFPSVEFANKLFYMLYVGLFPVSVLMLIKKLNGNIWMSLLSFLYLYNFNVSWGFVGYMFGIPVLLITLVVLYDFIGRPRLKDGLLLVLLLIFLFHIHGLTAIFAVLIILVQLIVVFRHSIKDLGLRLLVLIPVIVLIGLWLAGRASGAGGGAGMLQKLLQYYQHEFLPTFSRRLGLFYWDHMFLFAGFVGRMVGTAISLVVVAIALNFFRISLQSFKKVAKTKPFQYGLTFFLVTAIVYTLVSSIQGMFFFSYYRFSVYFFIGIICLGSLLVSQKTSKWLMLVLLLACVIHVGLWMDYFIEFKKENQDFSETLFPNMDKSDVLGALIYSAQFRGQPIYMHFPNYYIVWKKGIAINQFVEFPTPYVIGRKVDNKKLPMYKEWLWLFHNYKGGYDHLPYILVRGRFPKKDIGHFTNFIIADIRNEWIIMKNPKPGYPTNPSNEKVGE